ncbi:MAG TPA: hypothetical protein VJ932_08975 [Alkalispirochaeta sp.]|nr:hypothetical protein [Alkalispirochaeta sp.]
MVRTTVPDGGRSSRIRLFGVLLVVVLGITGCTRGTQGIFATIEVEEETKTSNLVDNTSATALVRTDLGDVARFVVQAGTKIFTRDATPGAQWSALSAPSGYIPTFLAGIDSNSSGDGTVEAVYAVFFDPAANQDYLYELEDSGGSLSWNRIPIGAGTWDPAEGRIRGLEGVNNRLVLAADNGEAIDDDTYEQRLYSFGTDLTGKTDLGTFNADDRGIRAAAANSAGDIVVIGNTVHVTDGVSSGGLSESSTTIENGRGVTAFPSALSSGSPTDAFLLGTLDGTLFTSTNGNSWTAVDGNIPDRSFSGVAWVDHEELLVVGTVSYEGGDTEGTTSARGYYEVTSSSTAAPYTLDFSNDTISDNYDGSELATSGIARFVYYPTQSTLFALSHGRGLWRTNYESVGPDWFWE